MLAAARRRIVEGCQLLERRMDVTSNNIANLTTCGFKRDQIAFREVLTETQEGIRKTRAATIQTDHTPGDAQYTGNPLDLALNGPGFFKVETPNGTCYTRNGRFSLNRNNELITSQGHRVMGQGGPITLKGSGLEIDQNGVISMDQAEDGKMTEVARIQIVDFTDASVLEKTGGSLYRAKGEAMEEPADTTEISQAYVEQSNVNVIEEMVKMIQIQRDYEAYRKIVQFFDESDTRLNNEVGRLQG